MYEIYRATCLASVNELGANKSYIGFTSKSMQERRQEHYDDALRDYKTVVFHKALLKYPEEYWVWEVIARGEDDIEGLKKWEPFYISTLKTKIPYGYNLADGGEGNPGYEFTEEQKATCGYSQTPCKCLELGITFPTSAAAARYIGNIINKKCDKSLIQKVCKRIERQAYGYHFSYINDNATIEEIDSMFKVKRKKVKCIETGITFNNCSEAAKWCNGERSGLRKAIINNWKYHDYHWIYI